MSWTSSTARADGALALLDDVPWEVRLEPTRRMRVESLRWREGDRVALRRTVAGRYLDFDRGTELARGEDTLCEINRNA
ncbi:hypothetical protein ACQKM2_35955 [Streptomyces sp. NPDC004126]|uniref:hypothetical protein n=1 Tax=Streptomyces sp. NPDC004126 TaxID=3390695 RepID=UPI003D040C45